jgi:hypothetical protein
MFKKFLLICLLITFSATSAPQNQSYLQQSPWNGWGGLVDWSFRSLRVGFALEDSLLEDGWVLADSGQFGYLSFDSLALDSLDLQYIHSVWGSVDTLVADSVGGGSVHATGSMTANNFFAADSLTAEYCTLTGTISAVMGAIDSVLTVSDSLHVAGNTVIDGRLFADSSVMVEDTLYTPYLAGSSPINVLDSLLTVFIGSSTSISATNNISANDLIATDSLSAVTGTFSGAVYGSTTIQAGSAGIFPSAYSAAGVWYSQGAYVSNQLTAWFYGINGSILSGGTNVARVIIGGPGEASTATSYLNSAGSVSTGLLDLIQNSSFNAATGWILSGCSISGGKLNKLTSVGVGTASQAAANMPIVASSTYLIHIDVDSLSAGASLPVSLGGTAFGNLTAEGSGQWLNGVTTNSSGAFSITWDSGETGILDNVYVYRLAGDFIFGGEVWNQTWETKVDRPVFPGEHIITVVSNNTIVTLPELAGCWNSITSAGREIVIENQGPKYCVVTTPLSDDAYNAIMGGDTLHLDKFETVTLRAVTGSHWAVQR